MMMKNITFASYGGQGTVHDVSAAAAVVSAHWRVVASCPVRV